MVDPDRAPAAAGAPCATVGCHTGLGSDSSRTRRGAGRRRPLLADHSHRPSELPHRADIGVLARCDPAAATQRRMVEHFASAPEQLGEDVTIDVELVLPLGEREPVHRLVHPFPDGGPLLLALVDGQAGPSGLLQQILHVQGPEERREEMRLQLRELKPSVVRRGRYQERERLMGVRLAAVVEGGNLCERIGVPLRQNAQKPHPAVQGGEGLGHVGLDLLPEAAPLPFDEGGQETLDGDLGRAVARKGDGHEGRPRPPGGPLETLVDAELGHHDSLVALHVAEGTEASESADGCHDQAGVGLRKRGVGETEGVHGCRTHRMHQDVARVHSFGQGGPALRRRDVDQPTALSPPQRRPAVTPPEGGTFRLLDHVDVRAVVGEELPDTGAAFGTGKLDDPQTF